jgi:hypothetical protein
MTQGNDRRPANTNAGLSVGVCRRAPRTTPRLPHRPRSGLPRVGRYWASIGPSTTRSSSSGASSRRFRHPATTAGSARRPSTSSGESATGWPTSKVRYGDTRRLTAADRSGYETGRAEVGLPRPLSRVCRGCFGLVRRLSAGTEPPTRAGEHDLGCTANND